MLLASVLVEELKVEDDIKKREIYAQKTEYQRSEFVQNLVRGAVFRSGNDLHYRWQVDGKSV